LALQLGLVGLPNAGKSTLFNAVTRAGAVVANYPFTTIQPNVGVVAVPDERLDALAALVEPERVVPATVEFVDIAGLVEGASRGEGLGNQFLGHIRSVDAVVEVVRCFGNDDVPHMYGSTNPARDVAIIATELGLADLSVIERRAEHLTPRARSGEREAQAELTALERIREVVEAGKPARLLTATDHDARSVGSELLTAKPHLYVANVDDDQVAEYARGSLPPSVAELSDLARSENAPLVVLSAKLEFELTDLSPEDTPEYLAAYGLAESGVGSLIRASYDLLDVVTFFTAVGEKEVRAWTIHRGTSVVQAAGRIHSDMERGFIRAEVISARDLVEAGGFAAARERGTLRLEGRDYAVRDGDVVTIRFNV
jgi:ribosome-binding ATPase